MAKLTAAQSKVLSMGTKAKAAGKAGTKMSRMYPGMSSSMNPARMQPLSSMGRAC